MVLKKVPDGPSTGIYQRWKANVTDPDDMREAFEGRDIKSKMEHLRAVALEILKPYVGVFGKRSIPSDKWPHVLPDLFSVGVSPEKQEEARRARDIMHELRCLKDQLAKGDAEWSAYHAFQLGVLGEMLGVLPYEPYVLKVKKQIQTLREQNRERYGVPDENCNQAIALYRQFNSEEPSAKKTAIYRKIAKTLHISVKTVHRRLEKVVDTR